MLFAGVMAVGRDVPIAPPGNASAKFAGVMAAEREPEGPVAKYRVARVICVCVPRGRNSGA